MTTYVFDHYLINGISYNQNPLTLTGIAADATITAVYIPSGTYVFDHYLINGISYNQNPLTLTGIAADATITAVYIFAPPITPTYILNWTMAPIKGNLPFTVTFSGYLSQNSSIPDTSNLVNGETIKLQYMNPGGSTWADTGIVTTTGTGVLGTGYFSGIWQLTEPGIYPGAWQFRSYYAGNVSKNMLGCDNRQKKRDLRRVNALIL